MFENYKIEPWFQLFAKQRIGKQEHLRECLVTSREVAGALRQKRKEYLGSDLGLTMFVHENGQPLHNVVCALSSYLGELTEYFLKKDYHQTGDLEELCTGFFYYSLLLYAYDQVGGDSFDDLIQLAELFFADIDVMTIILEKDLDEEIVDEWLRFTAENEYVPKDFAAAVTGALSVFLGVMRDPTGHVA